VLLTGLPKKSEDAESARLVPVLEIVERLMVYRTIQE